MKKLSVFAAALAFATPALAMDLEMGTELGTTQEAIRTALTGMGYDLRKIEMEDGKIEAYVVKDKTMAEVYVDPQTGKVIKMESK